MIRTRYVLVVATFLLGHTAFADLDDFNINGEKSKSEVTKPTKRREKTPDLGKRPIKPKPAVKVDNTTPAQTPFPKTPKKKKKIATKQDKKLPIKWSAKGLSAINNQKTIKLIKDVVVTQGNLRLDSDKATVYLDEQDEVKKVVATGRVKVVKEAEEKKDKISARGQEAIFYNETQMIVLKGRATLWRGGDVIKGKQISYNLVSGMITVDSVEGVVKPEEKKP